MTIMILMSLVGIMALECNSLCIFYSVNKLVI